MVPRYSPVFEPPGLLQHVIHVSVDHSRQQVVSDTKPFSQLPDEQEIPRRALTVRHIFRITENRMPVDSPVGIIFAWHERVLGRMRVKHIRPTFYLSDVADLVEVAYAGRNDIGTEIDGFLVPTCPFYLL